MIVDSLNNVQAYMGLSKNFKTAFEYLKKTDLNSLPIGKFDIDGKEVHANVMEYDSKLNANAKWEAHELYADIQIVLQGEELMGYCPLENTTITEPYNSEKDILFVAAKGQYAKATPGVFFVFLPQDAHQPSVSVDEKPAKVKKIVLKVKVK